MIAGCESAWGLFGGMFKVLVPDNVPRIAALLQIQLDARREPDPGAGPDRPLFTFDGQRCIHPGAASQVFHHLMADLQLPVPDGSRGRGCICCGTLSPSGACCVGIAKGCDPAA